MRRKKSVRAGGKKKYIEKRRKNEKRKQSKWNQRQKTKKIKAHASLNFYLFISGSLARPIPSPVSCLRSLLLCLFVCSFVCLFATIPTAKAVGPTTDEWQKGGKWQVESGKLSWVRWHFCILPIRSVAAGQKFAQRRLLY